MAHGQLLHALGQVHHVSSRDIVIRPSLALVSKRLLIKGRELCELDVCIRVVLVLVRVQYDLYSPGGSSMESALLSVA